MWLPSVHRKINHFNSKNDRDFTFYCTLNQIKSDSTSFKLNRAVETGKNPSFHIYSREKEPGGGPRAERRISANKPGVKKKHVLIVGNPHRPNRYNCS